MQLKSPDFGNTLTLDTQAIIGRTQDGDLIQIYDPSWKQEDSFSVTFSGLSSDERWAMINFYRATLGQQITFLDHENRTWLGFIYSKLSIRQPVRGCGFVVSFNFTGTLSI